MTRVRAWLMVNGLLLSPTEVIVLMAVFGLGFVVGVAAIVLGATSSS